MKRIAKSRTGGATGSQPNIFWHCLLVGALLAVAASFFYFRHQLVQRAERDAEVIGSFLTVMLQERPKKRNLDRWHDSSLILVAAAGQFQASNDGDLPARWSDDLLADRGSPLTDPLIVVTVQISAAGYIPAIDLPAEDNFQIWPGFVCLPEAREGYLEQTESLTSDQVVVGAGRPEFAIVYWAENLNRGEAGPVAAFKCLDSLNGYDRPDFILSQAGGT